MYDTRHLGGNGCERLAPEIRIVAILGDIALELVTEAVLPMAPEIPLHLQRPAEYVFSRHVEQKLAEIGEAEGSGKQLSAAE